MSLTIEKKIDGRHGVTFLWKYFSQLDGSVVLTSSGYMSGEDDELGEDGNYLDIIQSPSYSYLKKRFKGRRLICRVCKLKFRTREETQAHIRQEHRRIQTETK